jgi:hypothetical protein
MISEEDVVLTLNLAFLRIIGSPFLPREKTLSSEYTSLVSDYSTELYKYACKNKIGLLYLEQIRERGLLGALELEYEKQCLKHRELMSTAVHISDVLTSGNIKHAIIKTIMPYPAVCNDVDVLFLNPQVDYGKAIRLMIKNGFEVVGVAPEEIMFHDSRDCHHTTGPTKDVYDVDLYRKLAMSRLIYLDAEKLGTGVNDVNVLQDGVAKVLAPEAELLTTIVHAVVVEQIYCLSVYYTTLHYLAKLESAGITKFLSLAHETRTSGPLAIHFALTAAIHYAAHGFVPEKFEEILDSLYSVTWKNEVRSLSKSCLKMPHRYSFATLAFSLLERSKSKTFRTSLAAQISSTINPRFAQRVGTEFFSRRTRETY